MASFQDPGTVSDEAAYAGDFVDYLNESCSPFHCVAEVKRRLLAAGFTQLDERKPWSGPAEVVRRGGRYFVTRNGSSLIAFAVGGAFAIVRAVSRLRTAGRNANAPIGLTIGRAAKETSPL